MRLDRGTHAVKGRARQRAVLARAAGPDSGTAKAATPQVAQVAWRRGAGPGPTLALTLSPHLGEGTSRLYSPLKHHYSWLPWKASLRYDERLLRLYFGDAHCGEERLQEAKINRRFLAPIV